MEQPSMAQWTQQFNTLLKLFVIAVIGIYTYEIIKPLVTLLVWSLILTVALAPLHTWLTAQLKQRRKLAAVIITSIFLALIVGPFAFVIDALVNNLRQIPHHLQNAQAGTWVPDPTIQQWPFVGDRVYGALVNLSQDKEGFVAQHKEQIVATGKFVLGFIQSAASTVLLFMGAMLIAGILLMYTPERQQLGRQIGLRLAGQQGLDMAVLMEKTIRSVVKGVLGVAVIQAALAGLGFFIMDIPFAGLWTLLVLFLALIQVGALPVCLGAVIYGFTHFNTTPAVLFLAWNIVVSISDNFLKPVLMGRGLDLPVLVVFLGAIGGMLSRGILGLFLGPVILGVAYRLAVNWLQRGDEAAHEAG